MRQKQQNSEARNTNRRHQAIDRKTGNQTRRWPEQNEQVPRVSISKLSQTQFLMFLWRADWNGAWRKCLRLRHSTSKTSHAPTSQLRTWRVVWKNWRTSTATWKTSYPYFRAVSCKNSRCENIVGEISGCFFRLWGDCSSQPKHGKWSSNRETHRQRQVGASVLWRHDTGWSVDSHSATDGRPPGFRAKLGRVQVIWLFDYIS